MQTVSSFALCLSLFAAPQPYGAPGAGAPSQPSTLLFVTSSSCPHCDVMKPILARMQQEGYRIETIQGKQNPSLVRQLGVNGYPTFVLMAGGQEQGRLVGSTSYEEMVAFARPALGGQSAGPAHQPAPPRELPQDPYAIAAPLPVGPEPPTQIPQIPVPGMQTPQFCTGDSCKGGVCTPGSHAVAHEDAVQRALGATVRIKIDEGGSVSYGTGVVVDVHRTAVGSEALILTCGHIFRDSQGKAALTVDFPTRQDNQPVPGKLLEYVAKDADIGAIYVVLPFDVAPVPVAGDQYRSSVGDAVFSVGCDAGGPARVMQSKVTNIDRYIGPPNIEASGAPSLGRSGGGLFDAEGRLIGICNAMDAADDEGIYAALPLIHWQLAEIGMDNLYRRGALAGNALPVQPLVNTSPGIVPGTQVDFQKGEGPDFGARAGYDAPVAPETRPQYIAKITLQDVSRPGDPGETITIPASPQLLRQIYEERHGAHASPQAPAHR